RLPRAVRTDQADGTVRLARTGTSASARRRARGPLGPAGALRPGARVTRAAADWSEHRLERRFELGEPHDELTRLAAMLDSLLDRIAASLRREQRFSAELSHELRTPVSRIVAEADLAL